MLHPKIPETPKWLEGWRVVDVRSLFFNLVFPVLCLEILLIYQACTVAIGYGMQVIQMKAWYGCSLFLVPEYSRTSFSLHFCLPFLQVLVGAAILITPSIPFFDVIRNHFAWACLGTSIYQTNAVSRLYQASINPLPYLTHPSTIPHPQAMWLFAVATQ